MQIKAKGPGIVIVKRCIWASLVVSFTAGCGALPAPQGRVADSEGVSALGRGKIGTVQGWQARTETGTGNVVAVAVTPAVQVGVGTAARTAPASLRLTYTDKTGYFAGRMTLNGWCVLAMAGGRRVEVGAVSLGRQDAATTGPADFVGVAQLSALPAGEVPVALELAVSSSDRYGHLRWDSDIGRNYKLAKR